jgi:hypothetical protein
LERATFEIGSRCGKVSREFYVYVLANVRGRRPILYTGVTNDVVRRVAEPRGQLATRRGILRCAQDDMSDHALALRNRERTAA